MSGQIAQMYRDGMSLPQIAEALGIPYSRARALLLASGERPRSRAEGVRLAVADGRLRPIGNTAPRSAEARRRVSEGRLRWAEAHAAGLSLKPNGYVEHTRGPNKGRSEHAVIAEAKLGRRLAADECVHHIDHNRSNNDPNNLQVMTRSAHTALHRSKK